MKDGEHGMGSGMASMMRLFLAGESTFDFRVPS
jgi:hypothetical protein